MIKRVLLPLDASPFTTAATEAACVLARDHGAEITGLVVLDVPGIEKSIGPVPLGGGHYAKRLEGARLEQAEKVVEKLLATFRARCDAEGVRWQEAEAQGTPSEQIIEEAVYYDALVMGLRTFFRFDPEGKPGDTLDSVLEHSVTPVMGIPEDYVKPAPGTRVKSLLLFDGSLPAARSLQRFAQLNKPGSSDVTLVMADSDEELAKHQLGRAERYLAAHGFEEVRSEWTQDEIIEAVDERYLDAADLVVVGAHSKVAIIDFLIGSVTRHLIEVARKPILIGQ